MHSGGRNLKKIMLLWPLNILLADCQHLGQLELDAFFDFINSFLLRVAAFVHFLHLRQYGGVRNGLNHIRGVSLLQFGLP